MGEAVSHSDGSPVAACHTPETSSPSNTRGRTPTQRSHTAEAEAIARVEAETANRNQHAYYYPNNLTESENHHDNSSNNKNNNNNTNDDDDRLWPTMVYVVTDTFYPSASNFDTNLGTTSTISVHSSKRAANERAKKTIYENDGGCTVDIDKIIEEVKQGLYTGIGVGGKEEKSGCCFARKCEVEAKPIDDDSEDEGSGDSIGGGGSSYYDGVTNEHRGRDGNAGRRSDRITTTTTTNSNDRDMGMG